MREALEKWFHVNDDYYNESDQTINLPLDLGELNSSNCISGHFGHEGYSIDKRYPQVFSGFRASKRYRAFMFLRDPLAMRCSLFRHELKMAKSQHTELADAILPFNNYYARIINVTESNWQQRLDQYFFIGIADDLQLSFDLLAQSIGKPAIMLPTSNATKRSPGSSSDSLSSAQISKFKELNQLDYKIFNYAKQRMARLSDQLSH